MSEDERWMQKALELAELGRNQTSPNPLVGAVVVRNGELVGQGAHLKAGGPHAEVHALRMAGEQASGSTVYVTLEPCSHYGRTPPCAKALIEAGVARVVVAMEDPNPQVHGRGIQLLREAGIEVRTGVLSEQAALQNESFLTWVTQKRPFIVWKCAATLDGYIATETGHSFYVTGEAARAEVQHLRERIPAIAVGVETVLKDNPRLTVRSATAKRQPLRVIFDSQLRFTADAQMLSEPGRTLIYTTVAAATTANATALQQAGGTQLEVAPMPTEANGRVSLTAALQDLAGRGIDSLLVEGGATLASALLQQQLIDKVVYFVAPKLLAGGMNALFGANHMRMTEAIQLRNVTWSQIGDDLRCEGYPQYGS